MTAFADGQENEPTVDAAAKTVTVSNEDQFMVISEYSNSSADSKQYPRTFSGWTVVISADLDMTGRQWKPLLNFYGSMTGKVGDRTNATISNMTVSVNENAGLCGNSANGKFSYLTIAYSTFETTKTGNNVGNYAGAFSGNGFTSSFDNCHVISSTIKGNRFVGGITGYCYGNITNCTVTSDGERRTSISAASNGNYGTRRYCGDNVGGIVGFMGEGSMKVLGCKVDDAEIKGTRQVAGIAGLAEYGNTVQGNYVSNVTLYGSLGVDDTLLSKTTASVGGVVGQVQGGDSMITITDNYVGPNVNISRGGLTNNFCGWVLGDRLRATSNAQLDCTNNHLIGSIELPEIGSN